MGATPASIANAASEWIRPGWDQAHNTVAATIGPTPNSSSRSGRQLRMMARIAFLQLPRLLQHRVRATSQGPQRHHGARCLDVPRRMDAQAGGGVEHRGQLLTAEPGPDGLGCGDDQAEDL